MSAGHSPDDLDRGVAPGVFRWEIVTAEIWGLHRAGRTHAEIAAAITKKWGDRGIAVTAETVTLKVADIERATAASPLTRLAHLSKLEVGLELLRGQLAVAHANAESESHPDGRVGALVALEAVTEFVARFVDLPGGRLARTLRALSLAVRELDDGRVHPLLEKKTVSHRPLAGMADDTLVSLAVLALEAEFMETKNLDQSAARLARDLERRGYQLPNGKPITKATLKNWRARAGEGEGGAHPHAARRLRVVRGAVKANKLPEPRAYAGMLTVLDDWARTTGIRRKPQA
jgi:hypothetical protein